MWLLFMCSLLLQLTVAQSQYLNDKTKVSLILANKTEFVVNGSGLPFVNFDIGESYAGYLPNTPSGISSLYFWFFPSSDPKASDEITVWLNGGPGCSSLAGIMLENGPFLWQPGTYRPVRNPYAWNKLTNMVYIDQPAGTGFSLGPSTVVSESDVARQFIDFWKRFVNTFDLQNRKIYLTGESYAGQYIPYIASQMLDQKNETYFRVAGVQINDPYINDLTVLQDVPALATVNQHRSLFPFNDTFMAEITTQSQDCGYTSLLNDALTFPPNSTFPRVPYNSSCAVYSAIINASTALNPCFNRYHITESCPFPWNPVGGPIVGLGPTNYFNRSDVQKAINAYPTDYFVCKKGIFPTTNGLDISPPSSLGPLPCVIEQTNNTIIAHGLLDFELLSKGSLISIQNMTWNGKQGFERQPVEPLFVPYGQSGGGVLGTAHTERGLTFSENLTPVGYWILTWIEIPEYAPSAAYRQLKFLLGRISNMSVA
ncbi:alpha/beta-hydrolase [Aspergillus sclerotioniger CBS 115572]|uniref:Carboxypeptidase n=1 Tax=Aspergillus sclerotioniger CBS 115572 TaxID=1450535 RepID=A0A317X8A5_9EURO|nr:alpha/beta-hydrolase [Aspergillus sclerotioniger CBS 115572]PWY93892.1 alpha/beta-hydrolase [Aspergillus sclerotioniger CBS 115572]